MTRSTWDQWVFWKNQNAQRQLRNLEGTHPPTLSAQILAKKMQSSGPQHAFSMRVCFRSVIFHGAQGPKRHTAKRHIPQAKSAHFALSAAPGRPKIEPAASDRAKNLPGPRSDRMTPDAHSKTPQIGHFGPLGGPPWSKKAQNRGPEPKGLQSPFSSYRGASEAQNRASRLRSG